MNKLNRIIKRTWKYGLFSVVLLIVAAVWLWRSVPNVATAAWWNDNWSYRKAIVINSQYVEADLTDFPVLISFTDSNLSNHAQEDGDDFIFIDTEGKKLAHEIESFATSTSGSIATGTLVAWVKIPELSSTDDTVLYLYYGNATYSPSTGSGQTSASEVWDENYLLVHHMADEDNASTSDSTQYNRQGTVNDLTYGASSKIGYGYYLDESNDYYTIKDFDYNDTFTISLWMKVTDNVGNDSQYMFSHDDYSTNPTFYFYVVEDGGGSDFDDLNTHICDNSTNEERVDADTSTGDINTTNGSWHYITVKRVRNGTNRLYVDGQEQDTGAGNNTDIDPEGLIYIGRREDGEVNRYFGGNLDELRVSNIERSADWIKTSFTNQASTTLFLSPQAEEIGPGPVGYWTFDKGYGTTAYDESGQGNNGTITGAAWQDESMCVSGKCLYFDGSGSYIDMDDVLDVVATDPITISGWVKIPNDAAEGHIFSKMKSTSPFTGYSINYDITSHSLEYNLIYSSVASNRLQIRATTAINDNIWHHVTATYNGNKSSSGVQLYIDGKEESTTVPYPTITDDDTTTAISLCIGARNSGADQLLHGFIDEVKIYPYARSAEEIRQDYNAGLAGIKTSHGVSAAFGGESEKWMTDGLVGYWKFDETATTSGAPDASGNGNDGTYKDHASTTAGKFGNGGVFDGSGDYVDVADSPSLGMSGNTITISIWTKLDSLPSSGGNWDNLVIKGGDAQNNYQFAIPGAGGHQDELAFDFGSSPNWHTHYCDAGTVATGTWYNFVVVYNGSDVEFYKNGVIWDSEPETDNLTDNNSSSLGIGMAYNESNEGVDGQIDEVRIYNRALSPREVRKLYEWAPGPVAHWRFNEKTGTTAYDSAASTTFSGGNHGTLGGGTPAYQPTWSRGKYGSALEFDGSNDYLLVNDSDKLHLASTSNFTLSFWFNRNDWQTGDDTVLVAKRNTYDTKDWDLFYDIAGSEIRFSIGEGAGGDVLFELLNYQPAQSQWIFMTIVKDSTTYELFENGVSLGTDTSATSWIDSDDIYFGSLAGGDNYYDGYFDDVRIYNYVRTQKQIIEDMNAGHPAGGSPIGSEVLYLKFDEGYGGTAYDSSPQGNNGTLFPGTTGDNTATSAMWSLDGKFGRAMEFDGDDDYVDCGTNNSLMADQFSVSMWVKYDGSGGEEYKTVIGWTPSAEYPSLNIKFNDRPLIYMGANNYRYFSYNNPINLYDNNWHHVVFIVPGGDQGDIDNSKLYVDAQEQEITSTVSTGGQGSKSVFYVGKRASTNYYPGLLDDVRIYNFALNEDEIKLIYNQGKAAVMGSVSTATTTAGTHVPSWSASREYCVPGSDDYCAPPVLELMMDEKTGTYAYDTSGQGNDGELGGGTASYRPTWKGAGSCKYGNCLEFDGSDDYVNCAYQPSYAVGDDFTWSAWIKTQTDDEIIIGSIREAGVNDPLLWMGIDVQGACPDNVLVGMWWDNGGGSDEVCGSTNIVDNSWHYVVYKRDTATDKFYLYVDGNQDASQTDNTGTSISVNQNVFIGAYNFKGSTSYEFNGLIDHVRIYNYARTPAQIAWDYNKGKPIAYWKFDECGGGTIYDESRRCKNGAGCNNGTIQLGTLDTTATGTCASSSVDTFWPYGINGQMNSAGSFDGEDDYIEMGDVLDMGTGDMTISAWIKATDHTLSTNEYIMSKSTAAVQDYRYGLSLEDGTGYPRLFIKGNGGSDAMIVGNQDLADGNWYFLTFIYDRDANGTIYINGEYHTAESISSWDGQDFQSNNPFRIGCYTATDNSATQWYFDGLIDEVKIFNYALTEEQVKTEYNNGAVRFGE